MPPPRRTVSRTLRTICSSSKRVESIGMVLPELLLQRCETEVGDFGDGPHAVDGDHGGERAHQTRVLALDGLELVRRLVALQLAAPAPHPPHADPPRHVAE